MDPISLGLGVVGLGMSIFGGLGQSKAAHEEAQLEQQKAGVSMDTARLEMQQNDLRQQSMEMSARREQLETVRTAQRARAMALAAGTNQGAQYGSGVQGGMSETTSEGLYGLQGINQSLMMGRQMFGLSNAISMNKIKMAQLGGLEAKTSGYAATDAGIASLGGALMKAGPTVGNLTKGLFSGGSGSSFNPFNVTGSLY